MQVLVRGLVVWDKASDTDKFMPGSLNLTSKPRGGVMVIVTVTILLFWFLSKVYEFSIKGKFKF